MAYPLCHQGCVLCLDWESDAPPTRRYFVLSSETPVALAPAPAPASGIKSHPYIPGKLPTGLVRNVRTAMGLGTFDSSAGGITTLDGSFGPTLCIIRCAL